MIKYQGQWVDAYNSTSDPAAPLYNDQTYHTTQLGGATATVRFMGTEVRIFGAKRPDHGFYNVSIDGGTPEQYDGYAPVQPDGKDGLFQVMLFERTGMEDAEHTLVLTNVVNGNRSVVDIDFIRFTRSTPLQFDSQFFESQRFNFDPLEDWTMSRTAAGYRGGTSHWTTSNGAAAALKFDGSEVFLYAGVGPRHGMYKVQVDGLPEATLNGTAPVLHTRTLLYALRGLEPGPHQMVVTNLEGGKIFDIDYAEVVPHPKSSLTKAAIAGIVVGAVVGLGLLVLAAWIVFIRRRRRNKDQTDLIDENSNGSHVAMMRTYSAGRRPYIIEPFRDTPESRPPPTRQKGASPGEAVARQSRAGSEGDSPARISTATDSGTRSRVEVDAGALPPIYDEIVQSRVAEVPVRSKPPARLNVV
ncbi:hypothetical protein CTheo_3403 [Ceratobasidium theobromae]|uniref:Transmembrane protein n=1 Tax=Ceratobasidium theobromae TaxID=1582974 RepID=A0A5N5QNN5_9AGAM|nr:hypothetical protein CTheo_3403 [Ceratobasidium theobromae]